MSCKRSAGRQYRHHAVNDIIARTFRSDGVLAVVEPPGLLRGDGKRPDGTTLIPWAGGRSLLWEFTSPDTLAPSHLTKTLFLAEAAASQAEARKIVKYSNFTHSHLFTPVAIETLGVWVTGATELATALGHRLLESTKHTSSPFYFRQRKDMAVQRAFLSSNTCSFACCMFPFSLFMEFYVWCLCFASLGLCLFHSYF